MTTFFRLRSIHGTTVALDQSLGTLVAATLPLSPGKTPIVVCRLPSQSSIVILTAEANQGSRFHLPPIAERQSTLMFFRIVGESRVALMHPFSGKFVTAIPESNAPLHNTADQIKDWELFETDPVRRDMIPAHVTDRLAKADTLFASAITVDRVVNLLSDDRNSTDLLNAAIPLLPTDLLDELAKHVLASEEARRRLKHAFFSDTWANVALPELANWLARNPAEHRETGPSSKAAQQPKRFLSRWLRERAEPASVTMIASDERLYCRDIGPELDSLGTSALTGGFISLPHACTLRARRTTTPRNPIAIVATARNEGVYLLEWIAYHRRLGIESFYIYSNDNDDGSDHLLAALAEAGVITWIRSKLDPMVGNAQFKAYGHALSYMPDLLDYHWALVIDLDEFLVLDRNLFPSVVDFCDWHRSHNADTVAINWAFLRSEEIPVASKMPLTHRNQRLLTAAEMGEGVRLVKSMSRPNRVCHSEAHVPFTDERSGLIYFHASGQPHRWHNPARGFAPSPKFSDNISDDAAVVYHYISKSPDEWLWKNARNPGDHRLTSNNAFEPVSQSKVRNFLIQHNAANLTLSRRAAECVPDLMDEIKRLKTLPSIESLYLTVMSRYEEKLSRIKAAYALSPLVQAWDDDTKRLLDIAGIR
jgi:hypothetical protein